MPPDKIKKLERLAKVLDNGDIELLTQLDQLEQRIEGELEEVKAVVNEAVTIATETQKMQGEKGEKGDKGDPGRPGIDGKDGKDGIDGKDGKNGLDGTVGPQGAPGKDGVDGKDGFIYDSPSASNASSPTATAGQANIAIIEGLIKPSANGTVVARFASEISASAIVAKAGSTVFYQQVL